MQENWINKINEYHTTPPKAAWDNIACELDKEDESLDAVKLKLLAYETAAPAIVFKNIFEQLDKDDGNIHPIEKNKQNRSVIFMRMAVAASVITIAILLFFNNKKADDKAGIAVTNVSTPAINQPQPNITTTDSLPVPATGKKTYGQKVADIPAQKTNPLQAAVSYLHDKGSLTEELNRPQYANNTRKPESIQELMPVSSKLISALNRYITLIGPGGESIKLSSKFGSMLGVLNNGKTYSESNIDAIIKESSKWNNAFAGWRDKMTGNLITPSLINFLDIIELSEFLEEKKPTISQLDLRYLNLY